MSRIIRKDVKWVIATAPEGRPGPGVDRKEAGRITRSTKTNG